MAARELARRLERDGTPLELPVDELLAQFAVRRFDLYARERMREALEAAGIAASPDIREARRGGRLVVSCGAAPGDAPASGSRPAGATDSGRLNVGGRRRLSARAIGTWLLLAAAAAIVGATVLKVIDVERTLDWVAWHVEKGTLTGTPSSCGRPGYLQEIDITTASATYYNRPHVAQKSTDGDSNTAWIQTLRRNGGDLIAWSVGSDPRGVRLICIRNGWTRDIGTNTSVGRLARVTFSGARGKRELRGEGCRKSVTFPKRADNSFGAFESVRFDCEVTIVRLEIKSIYPGTTDPDDVALSDVRFYG
jgi:hypothetical protein